MSNLRASSRTERPVDTFALKSFGVPSAVATGEEQEAHRIGSGDPHPSLESGLGGKGASSAIPILRRLVFVSTATSSSSYVLSPMVSGAKDASSIDASMLRGDEIRRLFCRNGVLVGAGSTLNIAWAGEGSGSD